MSTEESSGWLMIEVANEGIAESSAGSCEVVAGEGGGVGGRDDARVGDQWPVGRVGLGREHVEANAGELPGVQVGDGGVGVEEGAAGDVDEPVPSSLPPLPARSDHDHPSPQIGRAHV